MNISLNHETDLRNVIDTQLFSALERRAQTEGLTRQAFVSGLANGDPAHLPELSNGAQADVTVIALKETGRQYIIKTIGREKGLSEEVVRMLLCETRAYQADLQRAGIWIPRMHVGVPLRPECNEGWQIGMVEELVGDGKNVKDMFQDPSLPNEEKVTTLEELADVVVQLPALGEPVKTSVGGDFRPVNFVKKNGYILVDTFAPKRVQEDGQIGPYVAELESPLTQQAISFLCGDRRGGGRIFTRNYLNRFLQAILYQKFSTRNTP